MVLMDLSELQIKALPNGGAFMHEYQEVAYDQNFSAIS